jgi:hypothetical protein
MVATGLAGIAMDVGDHVCAFYRGDRQRDEILLPYLRAGLRAGDKCVCVVDSVTPAQVAAEVDDEPRASDDQLSLYSSEECYLADGAFSTDEMLAFWEEGAITAMQVNGYTFIRSVGEMTWALRQMPGVEQLVSYEAKLNRLLPRYPQVILCLYDLEKFTDGEVLIDILRTHPKVLMSGVVIDNPWYIEPEELLAAGM